MQKSPPPTGARFSREPDVEHRAWEAAALAAERKAKYERRTPDLAAVLPYPTLERLRLANVSVYALNRELRLHGWDGCTFASDWQEPCCQMHDALYATKAVERSVADQLYRDCMIDRAHYDNRFWQVTGTARAWGRWAAVRIFGRFAKSWREVPPKEEPGGDAFK